MKHERVVISNLSESFIDFLSKDKTNAGQLLEVELSLDDQAVFWGGNHTLIIASHALPTSHAAHVESALNLNDVDTLIPQVISGRLSQDITNDSLLRREIVERTAKSSEAVVINQYAATEEFTELVKTMIAEGANIVTPELPREEARWVTKKLDLKSGFRQLAGSILADFDIRIPKGFVCERPEEVISMSYYFVSNGQDVIIKPNDGEDGMGQLVVPAGSERNAIVESIERNPFLRGGDAVVEEYIDSGKERLSPSVEFKVTDEHVEYLYSCRQSLSSNGTFLGVDIGPGTIGKSIKDKMVKTGMVFGNALHQLGYRGIFDIDFIVGKDQRVYAVESNLRRTGATHVHEIGKRLFGSSYESRIQLRSSDVDPCIGKKGMQCAEVLAQLDDILYPHLGPNKGVIITVSSGIPEGRLGYVIIGTSGEEMTQLQEAIHARLQ